MMDHVMETMRKVRKSKGGKMGEKQREKWREQFRMSLAGEVTEKDRERDTKKNVPACEPARGASSRRSTSGSFMSLGLLSLTRI